MLNIPLPSSSHSVVASLIGLLASSKLALSARLPASQRRQAQSALHLGSADAARWALSMLQGPPVDTGRGTACVNP